MDVSALAAGMRHEWRLLRRDASVWLTIGLLVALIGFALQSGAARVEAQSAAVAAARADEAQRLAGLRHLLTKIDDGAGPRELPPYRDPRNAVFVGGGPAAAVAALRPAPLALAATGQSDLFPAAIRVASGAKDGFLFNDEIENPAHLSSGSIDLAFVLVFVFPLAILALAYNLVAGERERGTLALTLACARDPGAALAGKLLPRAGLPIAAALGATALGVAVFQGVAALASPAFSALLAAILAYGAFWAFLAAAVDARGRSSAGNALTLIGAWALLTMVAPAAINSLAQFLHPSPSRLEMTLAARAATTDADRAQDAALARYRDEHPDAADLERGGAGERTLRRLAVQEAAFARVEGVIAAHDAQLARQQALADRLSFASPALLMYRAVVDLAGAGETAYRGFLARVDAFHKEWRTFFLARARAGAPLTLADYDALPRFPAAEASVSASDALAALAAGVGAPALLLALLAWRGFRRCRAS